VTGNGATPGARLLQAQGIVSVQADCSVEKAARLIRETAAATDQTVEHVADRILTRRLWFDPPDRRP